MIIVCHIIDTTHIRKYLQELKKYESEIKDNIYYGSVHIITNHDDEDNEDREDNTSEDAVSLNSSNDTMYDYSSLDTYSLIENEDD